ncbi:SixA phosphatase family protein [Stenoxybacter acetivorans]|uniref:SixA phosphatase family protein n=1 Tax=Stenoxybacter acetivorans TaxID=422441 RepID=UPI00055C662A|nr:histidine phosphatase family protein [Stenoxybacter acetivorans]
MELILWRHAEAEESESDLARKLTAKGQKQAKQTAKWLKSCLPHTRQIWVSQAIRSQQTAAFLDSENHVVPMLNPDADARQLTKLLLRQADDAVLVWVGHQPWLGQLCAYLLNEDWLSTPLWSVKKSGVWWFSLNFRDNHRIEARVKAVWNHSAVLTAITHSTK